MNSRILRNRKVRLGKNKAESQVALPASIDELISFIKAQFGESNDIVYRDLILGVSTIRAVVVYIGTLAKTDIINTQIMESVFRMDHVDNPAAEEDLMDFYALRLLPVGNISKIGSEQELIEVLLGGDTIFFMDGYSTAIAISTEGSKQRAILEPEVEHEVRGPRESFVENIYTNMAMIRRIINNQNLRFLSFKLGDMTNTEVTVTYLYGHADPEIVAEIKKRLDRIQLDGMLESLYVEEWIEDHPNSVFAQIDHTERPDRVAAMLLEGRVAIMVNGSPWVLIVPTLFVQFFTSSGDYYTHYYFATFIRWIRFVAFVFAMIVPAFYIALITMHQEMIPTPLALRIAGDRSGVPFPAIVEALIMELAFEILREAGIRLPKVAGQAVSIVGALVIGEAAVQAGIVSPVMVIVVAVTGISSFAIPQFSLGMTTRILRFPLMILASIAGIPGITIALLVILTYMASLKSFGVPYLSPVAPFVRKDVHDTFFRAPWKKLSKGKHLFGRENKVEQGSEFETEE
ncbi:spore germination protein [Brevibacillus dissolubilis]|uniref:spore germination protein n=1 Tax=Brevibacillus dissolubilis TaxID=1844116 RepID=UPI001115BD9C|nr:spore germination protein [Brevibacillus dissolubilis]